MLKVYLKDETMRYPSRLLTWIFLAAAAMLLLPMTVPADPSPPPTLETIQHRAFDFFWNETDPQTGLTKDRATNLSRQPDHHMVASTAATGYMLAALPVGVTHGWVSRKAAYARALVTLRFVHDKLEEHHGFYFHFVNVKSGQRVWNCEVSSVDTGLLLLGARVAGDFWHGAEVERLSDALTDRADWRWMQTNGGLDPSQKSLSMGWTPENGWLKAHWQGYSEASFLYWLALGSRTFPLTPSTWDSWDVHPAVVEGQAVFGGPNPLFMAQMAPGFFDVRGQRDRQGRDWWTAWRNAHLADQAYCARNPDQRRAYQEGFWGVTACDQPPPVGYGAYAPQSGREIGTVAPTAMLAAVLFTPDQAQMALLNLWGRHGTRLWGRYGFSNAFNVDKNWYDADVIGIDLGMTLLAIENHRSGLIWRLTKSDPVLVNGLRAAGFHPVAARSAHFRHPARLVSSGRNKTTMERAWRLRFFPSLVRYQPVSETAGAVAACLPDGALTAAGPIGYTGKRKGPFFHGSYLGSGPARTLSGHLYRRRRSVSGSGETDRSYRRTPRPRRGIPRSQHRDSC